MPASTFDDAVDLTTREQQHLYRRRRAGYRATSAVLIALMAGAVVDGTGLDVYGVDTAHALSEADGWVLDVRYGTVSRAALATPLEIEVTRAGGFDGPVTIAVSSEYLAMWDENGLDPQPTSETQDGALLYWTFEPPDGDVLSVSYDARIEPAAQSGASGRVAVVDPAGGEITAVTIRTRVLP